MNKDTIELIKELEKLKQYIRTKGMHDFNVETGKCKNCNEFIADIKMRLCPVITPEEVSDLKSNKE